MIDRNLVRGTYLRRVSWRRAIGRADARRPWRTQRRARVAQSTAQGETSADVGHWSSSVRRPSTRPASCAKWPRFPLSFVLHDEVPSGGCAGRMRSTPLDRRVQWMTAARERAADGGRRVRLEPEERMNTKAWIVTLASSVLLACSSTPNAGFATGDDSTGAGRAGAAAGSSGGGSSGTGSGGSGGHGSSGSSTGGSSSSGSSSSGGSSGTVERRDSRGRRPRRLDWGTVPTADDGQVGRR